MERDSIVFYKDWWEAIQSLPEDKRLDALTAVMDYAFAGVEPTDAMLRFATAQIRMFIDRDAKRYEDICEKRKAAIKKRWEKEKNKELKSIQPNTNEYKSIQPNTTHYLNENDNVNENYNEDDNEIQRINSLHRSDNNARARGDAAYVETNLFTDFFAPEKQAIIETLAMQLHVSFDELKRMAQEVVNEWVLTGQKHSTYNDASRHLISTLRKKKQWNKPQSSESSSEPGLGVGEYRNSKGQRTYAQSGVVVPESAPPRPSAAHWWSEASNAWSKQI